MLDTQMPTPKPRVIAGESHDWELVIGLEVHAQVTSEAKLFSGSSTGFGVHANVNLDASKALGLGLVLII